MRTRCTREGQDGALGGSMKMETSTPLVATGPLDEKGVTILFSDNKAVACTTKFIRDIIKDAIRLNHAKVVGERKPDWVYEMTDRRSLERVVRAAERDDIEIDTAETERIVGRLPEEADHPFEAYDFDPNVYADEDREERARQWRNEKARRSADAGHGRIEEVRSAVHNEDLINFDDEGSSECPTCQGEGWTETFGCALCGNANGSAEDSCGSTESEIAQTPEKTPEKTPAAMAASTLHQPTTPSKGGEYPIVGDTPTCRSIQDALDAADQGDCGEAVKLRVQEAAKAAAQAGKACGSFCGTPFHQWELPMRTDSIVHDEALCLTTVRLWLEIYNLMDQDDKCAGKIARFLAWVALAASCLFNAKGAMDIVYKVAPHTGRKVAGLMRKGKAQGWPKHVLNFRLQKVIRQQISTCRSKLHKYWIESNLMGEGWHYSSRWRMLFFMKKYESDERQKERTRLLRWKLGGLAALEQELPASSLQPKPKPKHNKQRQATKAVAAAMRTKRQKKRCGTCGTRQHHSIDNCVKCFPKESNGSARDGMATGTLQTAGKRMPTVTGRKRLEAAKVPRKRKGAAKPATPKCECNGCMRDCWFNPKDKTYSWACGMTCLNGKCNHAGSKATAGAAPVCKCHGCERAAYWDANFNTYGTHCGTTCRDGKCDHQDNQMKHTVAQFKLPSAAAMELTTTASGGATAQEDIMRENSVRILITPGDSEHAVEISGCNDNAKEACAQVMGYVSDHGEVDSRAPRLLGTKVPAPPHKVASGKALTGPTRGGMTKPGNQAKSTSDKKANKALGDSKCVANRPTKNSAESAPGKTATRKGPKNKQRTSAKRKAARAKRKGTARGSEPSAKRAAREDQTSTDSGSGSDGLANAMEEISIGNKRGHKALTRSERAWETYDNMSLLVIKTHQEEAENLLRDGWKPSGGSTMVKHPTGAQLQVAPPVASLMRALDGMSTAKPKLGRKPKAKGTKQGAMTATRQVILAEVMDAVRAGEMLEEHNVRQLVQVLARRMEKSIRGRAVMRKLREATDSQQRKINKAMVIQIILDATRQQPSEAEGTAKPQDTAAVVSIQGKDGSWRSVNKNRDAKITMVRRPASNAHDGSDSGTEDEDSRA